MIPSKPLAAHSPEPASEILRAFQASPKFSSAISPANESRLLMLFNSLRDSGKSYDSIRVRMLQLSFLLNFGKKIAPRFRSLPSPAFTDLSDSDIRLSQDRQFVDLHWLLCTGNRKKVRSGDYSDLFQSEETFTELADQFCSEEWSSQTKITALQISPNTQWGLACFQSANIRNRWRVIENGDVRGSTIKALGAVQIRGLLEDSVASQPRLAQYLDSWVTVWEAHKVSVETGMTLVDVYELITGLSPDRKGLERKLETVRMRIEKMTSRGQR